MEQVMDFGNFILNYLLQMAATLGVIFLFGKIIALCNGAFYRNFGRHGRAVCYATGFIGTPVHEASHALMCLLFGHRITEIKFFQLNSSDGTLGYVHHAYNPRNLYQKAGCFFIGVAPVLVGALILAGLLYLLLPDLFSGVSAEIAAVDFAEDVGASFGHIWQWTDGINVQIEPGDDGLSKVFVCHDPSKFNDTNYDGYSHVGNEARKEGYVKEVIFGEGGEIMPKVVGGGSTTYFCDNHYTNIPTSVTLRGVLFGGSADSGASAGFACANSSTAAPSYSYSSIGSRLCFIPKNA